MSEEKKSRIRYAHVNIIAENWRKLAEFTRRYLTASPSVLSAIITDRTRMR